MNSSAPAVTVFVAAFQRHPSPRTTLLRSVAPLEDVPCSFAEKSQSLLECRRTACRIRFPRSISRHPAPQPATEHAEGDGFGAENVTLGAFHGRIRLPRGFPRHPLCLAAAEHAEGEKSARDHRPISAILLASRNPPTNGSISPCHRNCANATDRTPGR